MLPVLIAQCRRIWEFLVRGSSARHGTLGMNVCPSKRSGRFCSVRRSRFVKANRRVGRISRLCSGSRNGGANVFVAGALLRLCLVWASRASHPPTSSGYDVSGGLRVWWPDALGGFGNGSTWQARSTGRGSHGQVAHALLQALVSPGLLGRCFSVSQRCIHVRPMVEPAGARAYLGDALLPAPLRVEIHPTQHPLVTAARCGAHAWGKHGIEAVSVQKIKSHQSLDDIFDCSSVRGVLGNERLTDWHIRRGRRGVAKTAATDLALLPSPSALLSL